jgi:hypothetical protein
LIIKIRSSVDELGEEVKKFATATDVSKEFLLNNIARVRDNAQQGLKKVLNKMNQVKQLLRSGTNHQARPPLPPMTHRLALSATMIDADM